MAQVDKFGKTVSNLGVFPNRLLGEAQHVEYIVKLLNALAEAHTGFYASGSESSDDLECLEDRIRKTSVSSLAFA